MTGYSIAVALHVILAVIWVGGLFFAHMVLRKFLTDFDDAQKSRIWNDIFRYFFRWVWIAVVIIPATGYGIIFLQYGGFANVKPHIHLMTALGTIMVLIFLFIYFVPFRKIQNSGGTSTSGSQKLMKGLVLTNFILGMVTIASVYLMRSM